MKLELQYSGHLMWRADSLGKTLMLGKIEGRRRRGQQRIRWLDGITDSMDMSLIKLQEMGKAREACRAAVHEVVKSQTQPSDSTTMRKTWAIKPWRSRRTLKHILLSERRQSEMTAYRDIPTYWKQAKVWRQQENQWWRELKVGEQREINRQSAEDVKSCGDLCTLWWCMYIIMHLS